jgi:hypothetical protein
VPKVTFIRVEVFVSSKVRGKVLPIHVIKAYKGSAGIAPLILTSTLVEGEWSASSLGHFKAREGAFEIH